MKKSLALLLSATAVATVTTPFLAISCKDKTPKEKKDFKAEIAKLEKQIKDDKNLNQEAKKKLEKILTDAKKDLEKLKSADEFSKALKDLKKKIEEVKNKPATTRELTKEEEIAKLERTSAKITGDLFDILTHQIDKESIKKAEEADLKKQDEWAKAYLAKIERANHRNAAKLILDKEIPREKEEAKNIEKILDDQYRAEMHKEASADEVEGMFDDSMADKIKEAEEKYAAELVERELQKELQWEKAIEAAARMISDLFDSPYNKAIEKAKRDKEITSKIYTDSASGLDIDIHLSEEDLERYVNKVLRDNWDLNKGTLDAIKSAKTTDELFSVEHEKWLEKTKKEILGRIYINSKSGLDIHLSEEDLERYVNKVLRDNWYLNKVKLDEIKAANTIKDLFDSPYKKATEKAKRDKEFLAKIYSDSKSGLDINIYLTDKEVKEILEKNKKDNEIAWAEAIAAIHTKKLFDTPYLNDLINLLKRKHAFLTTSLASLEKNNDQAIELLNKNSFGVLDRTQKEIENEKNALKKQIEDNNKRINEIEAELEKSNLKEELKEIKGEIADFKELLEYSKEESSRLEKEIKDFDAILKNALEIRAKKEAEEKKLMELKNSLDSYKNNIEKTIKEINDKFAANIKDLNEHIEEEIESKLNAEKEIKELLSKLEEYDRNWIYSDSNSEQSIQEYLERISEFNDFKIVTEYAIKNLKSRKETLEARRNKEIAEIKTPLIKKEVEFKAFEKEFKILEEKDNQANIEVSKKDAQNQKDKKEKALAEQDIKKLEKTISELTNKEKEKTTKQKQLEEEKRKLDTKNQRAEVQLSSAFKERESVFAKLEENYTKDLKKLEEESYKKEKDLIDKIKEVEKELKKYS
ncbi:Hypothetical protein, predicted lipoprotein [Metamycoplasma auris 15026]|uniref:Lipoprotein n=1 Tax=Metamycoplasma auris 15026 TaxID=1188233 RepID=N9TSH7_9BACT|nr:hypothetical protein [Metamycoplasma auris]ENY69109.1 Hypothetical protein, predicted lipoprotein [Metamycoplasma auris 15026]